MARPAEKARAMLNKWVAMRDGNNDEGVGGSGRRSDYQKRKRPYMASECTNLADAERYRNQIVREISDNISKIQNPTLAENTIRELNDDINKLLREKYHWNKHIFNKLGGIDYNALERKRQIEEGDTQIDSMYRYFGVAKNLPGVKELLEKEFLAKQKKLQSSHTILKQLTPDYFGWRDEEDGVLLELEKKTNIQTHSTFSNKRQKLKESDTEVGNRKQNVTDEEYDDSNESDDNKFEFPFKIPPTPDEVATIILERKKKDLIARYALM